MITIKTINECCDVLLKIRQAKTVVNFPYFGYRLKSKIKSKLWTISLLKSAKYVKVKIFGH